MSLIPTDDKHPLAIEVEQLRQQVAELEQKQKDCEIAERDLLSTIEYWKQLYSDWSNRAEKAEQQLERYRWVSVDERLPDEVVDIDECTRVIKDVLTFGVDDGDPIYACAGWVPPKYPNGGNWYSTEGRITYPITHWMPLPPTEASEGE